ncbi:MAG: hypothetical protein E6I25_02040 [Chloroflexi bacterium]|nr:MAG: hypothetical protein E6I25_02040 [Chloroflexota bacterium]
MKALDESKLRRRYRNAYIALYVIGGLTILLGLVVALGRVQFLPEVFAVEGAILIVFGYFTMRGSLLALGVATGLYAIDGVLTVASGSYQGIVIRLLILYFLVQGLVALRELKRRESMGTS